MRKIIYWVHTSVDGFIAGPHGEFDWPAMGPELSAYSDEMDDQIDTFLYGRVVWELMASYWPDADSNSDDSHTRNFAPKWRTFPKVVVSTTLTEIGWNGRVVDDLGEVAALKATEGKDILLTGGVQLASSLTAKGLIDDYRVVVHPVVLGGGPKLFPNQDARLNLQLTDTRTFDGRSVLLRYVPA
jgi:dihydrofolate reductase